ncbi:hypothetical protein LCGC14_1739990 [marine sediment metagenome]|uniref:Uncharacterized protein n=1 Tax=marine sediment metagenome TaxID=412755 RepID=A0A0F9H6Y8_9ZZZZ
MKPDSILEKEQQIKIHWANPDPGETGCMGELLWAVYKGEGIAEVKNIPFLTNEFGLHDLVRIEIDEKDHLEIVEVVNRVSRTIHATWEIQSDPMPQVCGKCYPEAVEEHKDNIQEVDKENWRRIRTHLKSYQGVSVEPGTIGLISISVPKSMDDESVAEMCDACPVSLDYQLEE